MNSLVALLHLIQWSDSALPVGTFSFSNGLETAAALGRVCDAGTLQSYVSTVVRQATFTEGIVALHAYRAALAGDYDGLCEADHRLMQSRMNTESRLMLQRMGRKMAELGVKLLSSALLRRWLSDLQAGTTPGLYPVAQALVFEASGLSEPALFAAHRYGTLSMVLGAALRCVRVSHFDTQRILFALSAEADADYQEIRVLSLDDMAAFAPQMEVWSALHEQGEQRMFMN